MSCVFLFSVLPSVLAPILPPPRHALLHCSSATVALVSVSDPFFPATCCDLLTSSSRVKCRKLHSESNCPASQPRQPCRRVGSLAFLPARPRTDGSRPMAPPREACCELYRDGPLLPGTFHPRALRDEECVVRRLLPSLPCSTPRTPQAHVREALLVLCFLTLRPFSFSSTTACTAPRARCLLRRQIPSSLRRRHRHPPSTLRPPPTSRGSSGDRGRRDLDRHGTEPKQRTNLRACPRHQ